VKKGAAVFSETAILLYRTPNIHYDGDHLVWNTSCSLYSWKWCNETYCLRSCLCTNECCMLSLLVSV